MRSRRATKVLTPDVRFLVQVLPLQGWRRRGRRFFNLARGKHSDSPVIVENIKETNNFSNLPLVFYIFRFLLCQTVVHGFKKGRR